MAETLTGGKCCPIGSEPALKSNYVPKGTEDKIGDLPIYTVGQGEKAIIFSYDIFGVKGGRTQLMCDQLADAGFFVILPDWIRGDVWPSDKDFTNIGEWFAKYPWEKIDKELNERVFPYLDSKGVKRIGMIGCCWGAATVLRASKDPRINAGVSFHLTLNVDLAEKVGNEVNCPQLVLPAANDPVELKQGGILEKTLKAKLGEDKVVFRDFPEMVHGWVPRGDVSRPEVARDVKIAMEMAVDFLKKYV